MGRQRGTAQPAERFTFEPDGHDGVTVMRDGFPQSHVVPERPTVIEFEYVQHLALIVDSLQPEPPAPLSVTHIGGAGLTLPRYVEATRPGSPQIVLEPDTELTDAVRRELPLPRQHRIRVRGVDGAMGLKALKDASADVVVLDAFADGRVPAELVDPEFMAGIARVLGPHGALLANISDEPGFAWATRAIATARTHLPHTMILAGQEVLKGRRFGNLVLAAAASDDVLDIDDIRRRAARAMFPTGVRAGQAIDHLLAGARPFTSGQSKPSPPPPQVGSWRVR